MDRSREVVITGIGTVSPIGIGRHAFWLSLLAGRSGVALLPSFEGTQMPVRFGAEIRDFDAKQYVKPRKALKVMCRELQTAFAAYALAVEDARLAPGAVAPERVGTLFGSEMLYGDVDDFTDVFQSSMVDGQFSNEHYASCFASRIFPLWMLKNLPNMPACHVAIAHDAQGPCNTIVSGDVSSLLAMVEAMRVMERGQADVMLVGGTGSRVALTGWLYRGSAHLSHRNDDPVAASRPFDRDRDGVVLGEGAAMFVLETRAHAESRGATIYASVASAALAMAAQRSVAARRGTVARLLRATLDRAGLTPHDLGHVNAHGLSTLEEDQAEAQAIAEVCGSVPVTALKSYFGNLGAASGLMELAGSLLAMHHDRVPKTLNYERSDPACPIEVIRDQPLADRPATVMKIGFSTTGQAAALVLRGESQTLD